VTPSCPYCRTPIDDEANRQDCSGCGTPHHADCYAENGGCTVFGCAQAPADEPKVTISVADSAAAVAVAPAPIVAAPAPVPIAAPREEAVWRPTSVLGLSAPPIDAQPAASQAAEDSSAGSPAIAPPLPPPDTTAVAPPPLPPGVVPTYAAAPARPMSLAEIYGTYQPPKSRVVYVLLGIFLGALGVHNFYAGYVRKAAAQLCISLFTCFYGSFVSWIWAVVEVCTVNQDSEGVQFS
jgi:TM2 domain-containing membrane protein YozV